MVAKKPQSSRVSASKRGEGSKPKPKTTRVSASKRAEGSKPVAPKKPSRIEESGVTAASIAKLAGAAIKAIRGGSKSAKPKPSTAKSTGKTSYYSERESIRKAAKEYKATQRSQQLKESSERQKAAQRRTSRQEAREKASRGTSGYGSNFRAGPRGREIFINGRWVRD